MCSQLGIGIVNAITASFIIIALTLYFLSSLTGMKNALYAWRPRTAVRGSPT